jgi:glycosyltransferase involved in cell wall biosynthesis
MNSYSSPQSFVHAAPPGVAVLVTTYEPGRALLDFVEPLICAGTSAVIVVDDGSSSVREWVLHRLALEPTVHLVRHSAHQGRGAALKTGIRYFLEHLRHYTGLVTASAAGEYAAEDVLRMARALHRSPKLAIVAAREFPTANWGNRTQASPLADRVLRLLFRVFTGIAVSDVQTGLRGLPTELLPRLLRIRGRRFDYELATLLHIARSGYPLAEHAVPARVEEHSADPEFRPVSDSISMLRALLNCTPVDAFTPEHAAEETSHQGDGNSSHVKRSGAKQTH